MAFFVYKLDRISRDLVDFSIMWKEFKAARVTFISLNEQFDTSSAIPVIIAIVPFVHGVSDIVRYGFCCPFAAALRGNVVSVQVIANFT